MSKTSGRVFQLISHLSDGGLITKSGNSSGRGYGVAARLLNNSDRSWALGLGMSSASVGMIYGFWGGFVFHQFGLPMFVMVFGMASSALLCTVFT